MFVVHRCIVSNNTSQVVMILMCKSCPGCFAYIFLYVTAQLFKSYFHVPSALSCSSQLAVTARQIKLHLSPHREGDRKWETMTSPGLTLSLLTTANCKIAFHCSQHKACHFLQQHQNFTSAQDFLGFIEPLTSYQPC